MNLTPKTWQRELNKVEISSGTQFVDVIKMGLPPISTFNKGQLTRDNGIEVFELCVIDILTFYGAEKWNHVQIRKISELLFANYYHWSFAELKLFLHNLQSGMYGKMYGAISPAYITEAALTFNTDLIEARIGVVNEQKLLPLTGAEVSQQQIDESTAIIENLKVELKREKDEKEQEYQARKKAYELKKLKQYCDTKGLDFETERKNFTL